MQQKHDDKQTTGQGRDERNAAHPRGQNPANTPGSAGEQMKAGQGQTKPGQPGHPAREQQQQQAESPRQDHAEAGQRSRQHEQGGGRDRDR